MLKKNVTVGLVRIIVVFTKIYISKVMSVSMETNPLKMKPYLCSTFSKSLKSLQYKVYPQWSLKKATSNWTSMPGCTIATHCSCFHQINTVLNLFTSESVDNNYYAQVYCTKTIAKSP